MYLLVTNERDITTDFVVLELRRRGLPFYRLNTEKLPGGSIWLDLRGGESTWGFSDSAGETLEFSEVAAAYFRRPGSPEVSPKITDNGVRSYCVAEWQSVLSSALRSLSGVWLNAPDSIARAEDKPYQLQSAIEVGLAVPSTLITNDFAQVKLLFRESAMTVAKTVRTALIESNGKEQVIFTSRLTELPDEDAFPISAAPAIYQEEVEKLSDIRVTVVGDRVFAVSIDSQSHQETVTDWRKGMHVNLEHRVVKLPDDIETNCMSLVKRFGLRFAAIDLVQDRSSNYWFLELNPNGQWGWIEKRTGLPIAAAIVDELQEIADGH